MHNRRLKVMKWQMAPDMIKMPRPILVVPWNLLSQCGHHLGCSHFKWSMIVGAKWMRHSIPQNVGTFDIPRSTVSCVPGKPDERYYCSMWTVADHVP